ncbi:MAG: nuclear transport factor 2 family protein [Telluria sp.]
MNDALAMERVVRFYETIDAHTLHTALAAVYAPDARFKDPFNEVIGVAAIGAIFVHMFEQVGEPRFKVTAQMAQDGQAFLVWEFRFRLKQLAKGEQRIRGASHIRFNGAGLVAEHRDYWDAAEELYEKLPLVGGLMRLLKRAFR